MSCTYSSADNLCNTAGVFIETFQMPPHKSEKRRPQVILRDEPPKIDKPLSVPRSTKADKKQGSVQPSPNSDQGTKKRARAEANEPKGQVEIERTDGDIANSRFSGSNGAPVLNVNIANNINSRSDNRKERRSYRSRSRSRQSSGKRARPDQCSQDGGPSRMFTEKPRRRLIDNEDSNHPGQTTLTIQKVLDELADYKAVVAEQKAVFAEQQAVITKLVQAQAATEQKFNGVRDCELVKMARKAEDESRAANVRVGGMEIAERIKSAFTAAEIDIADFTVDLQPSIYISASAIFDGPYLASLIIALQQIFENVIVFRVVASGRETELQRDCVTKAVQFVTNHSAISNTKIPVSIKNVQSQGICECCKKPRSSLTDAHIHRSPTLVKKRNVPNKSTDVEAEVGGNDGAWTKVRPVRERLVSYINVELFGGRRTKASCEDQQDNACDKGYGSVLTLQIHPAPPHQVKAVLIGSNRYKKFFGSSENIKLLLEDQKRELAKELATTRNALMDNRPNRPMREITTENEEEGSIPDDLRCPFSFEDQ